MQWLPVLRGVIDRRILVNFRLDPDALAAVLPAEFRPRTVPGPDGEYAIGGICCLRLKAVRPRGFPALVGITSENAAHRIGVEWDADGDTQSGVYIPRRDTDSHLNSLVGSRGLGRHYHADFDVTESDGRYELTMENREHDVRVHVTGTETADLPEDSIFPDVAAASNYHECGSVGYCPTPNGEQLAGVELVTDEWHVTPLDVESVAASFFENELPADAVTFDNALLMRDIGHEWHQRPAMATAARERA